MSQFFDVIASFPYELLMLLNMYSHSYKQYKICSYNVPQTLTTTVCFIQKESPGGLSLGDSFCTKQTVVVSFYSKLVMEETILLPVLSGTPEQGNKEARWGKEQRCHLDINVHVANFNLYDRGDSRI